MINTILLFLAIPYVFWGLTSSFVLWTYYLVHDEDDFHWGASVLITLLIAGLAWRYDIVLVTLTSWPDAVYALGGYVLAGVALASYKWVMVLVDFRPKAREWLDAHKDYAGFSKEDALSRHVYDDAGKVSEAKQVTEHPRVEGTTQTKVIFFPNWKAFPIANWITFWPLFIFSVALDPLWRAAKRLVKWLGNAMEALAKRFAVS